MLKRIAANHIVIDGKTKHQCVVEIKDGSVISCNSIMDELSFTEWFSGTLEVVKGIDGKIKTIKHL